MTHSQAALWTDGRYFLQASKQLDNNWILQKATLPGVPSKEEWLNRVLEKGSKVGVDAKLVTVAAARKLADELQAGGHSLSIIQKNLVDTIWDQQPAPPANPVFPLDIKYTGQSCQHKLAALRETLASKNSWGFIINTLDEIAWLFNLRGSDIPFNPVFFAYSLVTHDQAILYLDQSKMTKEVCFPGFYFLIPQGQGCALICDIQTLRCRV